MSTHIGKYTTSVPLVPPFNSICCAMIEQIITTAMESAERQAKLQTRLPRASGPRVVTVGKVFRGKSVNSAISAIRFIRVLRVIRITSNIQGIWVLYRGFRDYFGYWGN